MLRPSEKLNEMASVSSSCSWILEVVVASLLHHRVGVFLEGNEIILHSSCLCLGRDLCQ
jgi:hypothetical protein